MTFFHPKQDHVLQEVTGGKGLIRVTGSKRVAGMMEEGEKKVAGEEEKEENKEDKFLPTNVWESKVVQEVLVDLKIA